jgi:hypothetical protein
MKNLLFNTKAQKKHLRIIVYDKQVGLAGN